MSALALLSTTSNCHKRNSKCNVPRLIVTELGLSWHACLEGFGGCRLKGSRSKSGQTFKAISRRLVEKRDGFMAPESMNSNEFLTRRSVLSTRDLIAAVGHQKDARASIADHFLERMWSREIEDRGLGFWWAMRNRGSTSHVQHKKR
jgi:hypothetical protein